ncbi:MAG: replication initiation factor domain-containing protein, partial [Flavobacterium sp.]|uniref:replication initiation factor domain-containing protein n=1 Tax=Flavobacterium sp. TaxID=239 RepID=UPI0026204153
VFCEETGYKFTAINRLDICIDKQDNNHSYRSIYDNIINGSFLISGRPKNLQSYFETFKGKSVLNGFQIGKRTSDKIVRVYNKTLSLQLTEKPYINDFYTSNGFKNENIWRFEYQLNSAFFRNLKEFSKTKDEVQQDMTWGIFNISILFELLKIATKGFFELHENTGKSQINKEKKIELFDFDKMREAITKQVPVIKKLKKAFISTTTIKKRLSKSLFREYYANEQDISYIIALNLLLEDIDLITEKKLKLWFQNKMNFYLHEFRLKEKIVKQFDKNLFNEHQLLFL